MGKAFAMRFAQAGMNIVLADIEEPVLTEAVEDVKATGVEAIAVVTDVSDEHAVGDLASTAIDTYGQVNVVCNNAGVAGSTLFDRAGKLSTKDWKWVIDVNLWGVIHGHQAFLPHLLEHGDGHIINTASMAGHFPGHSAYSASKWAVVAITEGLFQQMQTLGSTVGVSCLCPGWVDTKIADSDRNRPEWAAPDALATPTPGREESFATVRDQLASGMAPTQVAELVHDAVIDGSFWIFTDLDMVAALQPRFDAVLNNANPQG